MRTLVYLSYGQGGHIRETVSSILSALDRAGPGPRTFEIVVYTDDDRPFKGLPVAFEILDKDRLHDWTGPHGYKHRRKIMTLIDALDRYRGRVAFIDSDTCFKRSPGTLFDRIAPGRPCLHLREGRLASVRDGRGYDRLAGFLAQNDLIAPDGHALAIPADPMMWNSGVIGMDAADAHLLPRVVDLIDGIWSRFQATLQSILPARADPKLVLQDARRVYAHRPRPRLRRRCKPAVVHRLQDAGLLQHRMRASG